MHENLVVARKCVHKAEQLVPKGRVDQCIDAWEREAIFWTSFVGVGEVHAHSPLSIRLLHQDHIHQLVGVVDLLDELCPQELFDLHSYGLDSFRCELPSLLLHRLHVKVHIQNVDNLFRTDPWHVFIRPSEHLHIPAEEVHKAFLDFLAETSPDLQDFSFSYNHHLEWLYWFPFGLVHLGHGESGWSETFIEKL
jgi:hypothetical protein